MEPSALLCPSSRCEEGALLLGIISEQGSVMFAAERIQIDREFVQSVRQGRSPEKRFRFSSPCVKCACKQWAGDHCSVIGRVLADLPTNATASVLPACSIRTQCRWFHQAGAEACQVCPLVITDLRKDPAS